MKKVFIGILLVCIVVTSYSQAYNVDSVRQILNHAKGTTKVDLLNWMAEYASQSPHSKGWVNRADTQKYYATIALEEAEKLHYKLGKTQAVVNLGSSQWLYSIPLVQAKKDFIEVMKLGEKYSLSALALAESINAFNLMGAAHLDLSGFQYYLYKDQKYKLENQKKALHYYNKAGNEAKEQEVATWLCDQSMSSGLFEEGFQYCQRSAELAKKNVKKAITKEDLDYRVYLVQQSLINLSSLHAMGGDYPAAINYLVQSRNYGAANNSKWTMDAELGTV